VTAGGPAQLHRDLIIMLAARHKLPAVYFDRAFVAASGLVSYGPDRIDLYRRAAGYVDRILKGEKPGDLPVQAPTKYELVINLVWGVFCQAGSARVLSIFIVGFLVRSESPFPRPDHAMEQSPARAGAVKAGPLWRPPGGLALTAPSTTAGLVVSG
jgi:ABC transporter substrate binding protein